MKKILLFLLVSCIGFAADAQSTANGYTWSQGTGTYTAISGASTAIASGWNDNAVSGIGLGFTFNFMGSNYTTVSVNANGWIAFGTVTLTTTTYTGISTLGGGTNGVVCAASMNLQDAASSGQAITYSTTGSSPNRVFTVQWTNCRFSAGAESLNFQIKLYETSNIIQVVYGTWATSGSTRTMQVGIRGTAITDFSTRTTTTNWAATTQGGQTSTMTRTTAINPASGLSYYWCPNGALPSVSVSPTSGCSSYSATASGGSTYTWLPSTGLTATTGSSVSVSGSTGSIYEITGYGSNGCSSKAWTSSYFFTPTAGANRSSVCTNDTTMLSAGISPAYAVAATTYSLTSTSGFSTGTSGDDASAAVTIPFTFNFFGTGYTSINLNTNGWANFGTSTTTGYPGTAFPNATNPSGCIGLFIHDMNTGTVTYGTVGSAPNRVFVINYSGYGDFTGTGTNTGQIKLYETSNIIECHVLTTVSTNAYTKGCGIQNIAGSVGYNAPGRNGVIYNIISGGEAWQFIPYQNATYSWAPAAGLSSSTSATPVATVSGTTIYTLTATIGSCSYTATKTVTALALPTVAIVPTNGCYGINMTASGGTSYTWAPATGLSTTNSATTNPTPGSATTYTVTATNASGCKNTGTKTVNLLPSVSVSPASSAHCSGGAVSPLSASGSATSYTWAPAATLSASTGSAVNASPTSNTTYTLTGTDAATGCSKTATAALTVNAALTGIVPYVASDTVICYPGYSLMLEGGTGGTWTTSDPTVFTVDGSGNISPVGTGYAKVYYTNACGTDSLQLRISSGGFTVSVTPSPGFYCTSGGPVTLVGSSSGGADLWLWTNSDGSPATSIDSTSNSTVHATPSVTSTYALFGTNSSTGCHAVTTVTVINNSPAAIAGGVTNLCTSGGATTTTWTDATSGGTWSSSNTGVATVNSSTGAITSVGAGSATITYTVTSTGCYVTRAITVSTPPTVSVTPATVTVCAGSGVSMTASGATTYTWSPATGLSATTGATVTTTAGSSTTYTVTGSTSGCSATATKLAKASIGGFSIAAAASPTSVCPGGTTTLSSSIPTYTKTSITYSAVSTTGFSTAVTGDDVNSGAISIPFSFNFFGTSYSSVYVCTNGWVSFTSSSTNLSNYSLPSTAAASAMGPLIAMGMHDMNAAAGSITYGTLGTAPNRTFVISFSSDADYSCGGTNTGQIILYESSNVIDILVGTLSGTCSNTVGIENAAGTTAYTFGSPTINGTTGPIGSLPAANRFAPAPFPAIYSWSPAAGVTTTTASSTTATVSTTTTYTVTLSDTSGCSTTGTTAVTVYTLPTVTIAPSVVCVGSNMTASGATTYTWSPATSLSATTGATVTPTPSSATSYTVTGTDVHGCTGTASQTVYIPPTVTVSPTAGCAPQSLAASGALTYAWTPATSLSATTGSGVTANPSGAAIVYTVTGTDVNGCTGTATTNIGPAPPAITGASTVCATLTTTLSDATSGGTWSTSDVTVATVDATTGVVTGVNPGSCTIYYTVGTCSPVSQSITVLTSPSLSVTATGCAPSASLTASGATNYSWAPATGLSTTTGASVSASPSSITIYTVTGDNGTCAVTAFSTVYPTPAAITGTATVCAGSNITLADGSPSGTWSSSNTSLATVDATTGLVHGVAAGSPTISYGYTACPSTMVTQTVTVNALPTVSATPATAATCGGVGIALTASGAVTYTWTPATGLSATTGASVTATPATATVYTITGTDANGCVNTLAKTVGFSSVAFTASVTATPAAFCPGGSSTLTASTAASNYSVSSTTYSLVSFTSSGSVAGDDVTSAATIPFSFNFYGVSYSSINICTNGWASFTSTSTNLANYALASTTAPPACISVVMHDLATSGFGSTGAGSVTYGTTGTTPNRRFIIYYNGVGNYSGGGTITAQIILYETSNTIDIMLGAIANGTTTYNNTAGIQNASGTVAATPTGRNGAVWSTTGEGWHFAFPPTSPTYAWSPAATLSSTTATSTTATPSSSTTYSLTVTDASTGCSASATSAITVYALPTIAIAPSIVCVGSNMTASGATTYTWSPSTALSATTGATVTPTPSSATTYTVTGTDAHGCVGTTSTTVYIPPTVTVSPTAGCAPQTLSASGAIGYTWTPGATLSATTGSSVTANPTASAVVYTVTGTNAAGCTGTATANVGPAPGSITGTASVCVSLTTALGNSTTGGTWSSSNTGIATVDATTGVVTGVAAGSANISYSVGTCTPVYVTVTVLTSPVLSVTTTGCAPSATLTALGATNYSWAPATGLSTTTGSTVSASPSSITIYTVTGDNGTCAVTAISTVYPTPASISGSATVCSGSTTTLTDASPSGTWSSSSTAVATVDATTGVVTGVGAGSVTISYGYSACPSTAATASITVYGVPSTTYTGSSNCTPSGTALTLSYAGGSGTYSWSPATYLSATTGSSVTCTPTSSITYTVVATGTGGCTATTYLPIQVISASAETPTATPSTTCAGGSSLLSATIPYSGYSVASTTYALSTITTSVGSVAGDDVASGAVSLPFTFNYYGTNYSSLYVTTDGWVSFTSTVSSPHTNYGVPSASLESEIGAGIAFGVHDLATSGFGSTGAGSITYGYRGSAPNRLFIIYFNGLGDYSGGGSVSGQVILHETSNIIDVMITSVNHASYSNTFGIQSLTGTVGVAAPGRSAFATSVSTAEGWRFSPTSFSYSWSPATSLSATTGSSVTLTSAPGAGTYSVTATDATTGCFFTGSTTITTGAISVAVSNPPTVCSGATGTWTITGPAGATVYYNINGGSTTSVTLSGTTGTVSQTISASTTLNLVSITAGSCSNSLSGSYNIYPYCVCTPQYYYYTVLGSGYPASTYAMNAVSIPSGYGSTSLSDAFTPTAAGYVDRTSLTPIQLQQSISYSGTISYNTTYYYYENQIWIDFNDDGTFAASEAVTGVFGTAGCTTTVSSDVFSLTIPLTAPTGSHRMRVRNANTLSCTNSTAMDPCAYNETDYYYYGSTADYQVTIVALPACSGTPTGGTAAASASGGCAPYSSTMSVTGATSASALSYQWQMSTTGSSYTNISGATDPTYAATVNNVNEYYQRITTCTVSSLTATSAPVIVHAAPVITGSVNVCQSGTTTLADALSGGSWSSSATGIATIDATTGVVTGVAAGAVNMSYATTGCTQVYSMNVVGVPASIAGSTSICNYATTTLTDATTGGSWSSSDTTKATVNSSTGVVTGVGAGTLTITYATGCGTNATYSFTVNTAPAAITGPSAICTLSTGTLVDAVGGGSWSTSTTTIGTINSSTGVFSTNSSIGTTTVSYTIGTCYTTALLSSGTVAPVAISGTPSACVGATSTLTDATSGGLWSSSATSIALVGATTGVVTAVANGTATITYNNGCGLATTSWTTNGTAVSLGYSSGSLSSPAAVCSGGTLNLSSGTTSGGTYSWSGPGGFSSASQNPTISGVTAAASGVYTFSATVGGCASGNYYSFVPVDAAPTLTVTATPSTICAGGTSTLADAVAPSSAAYTYYAHPYYTITPSSGWTAGPSGDDINSSYTLPFTFNFYGTNYSSINICTNGFVSFTSTSTTFTNTNYPSTSEPLNSIGIFQGDLNTTSGGNIQFGTNGTAPNRQFVINYNSVAAFGGSGVLNGEIILYEGTNVIDVSITNCNAVPSDGGSAGSIGIQNASGSGIGIPGYNAVAYVVNAAAPVTWRFAKPSYSYAWSPATGLSATTGSSVTSTGLTATQTYSVTNIDAYSGCTTGASSSVTLTVNPLPAVYAVTGGGAYCSVPGTGVHIGVANSESGVNYQLYKGASAVGSPVAGTTGSAVDFGLITDTSGVYTVVAVNATTGCTSIMTGSATVTINPSPAAYAVTGGSVCSGAGTTIGVASSQSGVSYQLYNGGSTVGGAVSGTGSAISFGAISSVGVYTVLATGTGGCTTAMTGSSTISASPATYSVTGGNGCSATGVDVQLFGSQSGATYQLYNGITAVGGSVSGTGSALDFGTQTTAGNYYVVATAPSGCVLNMNGGDTVYTTPSISLGANPNICQPASTANITYATAIGSPTTYSITYSAGALGAGFTNVSGGSLSGGTISLVVPSGATGTYSGSMTVSNGYCTSSTYTFSVIIYAFPTAGITSATAPCMGDATNVVFTGTSGATIYYSIDGATAVAATLTGGTYNLGTGAVTASHTYELLTASNPVCTTTIDTTITVTPIPMTWVGGTSGATTDWNTATNWSCGYVPTVSNDVTIPSGTTYAPVIAAAGTGNANSLTIASGVIVTVNSGGVLNVKGNLNNSGSVKGAGALSMNGTAAQHVTGIGKVYNFDLNNSTGATVDAASSLTVGSTLSVTSGTLTTNDSVILNSDSTITARVASLPATGSTIAGNVRVMQYIGWGRRAYRFWAHPFSTYIPLSQIENYIDVTGPGGATNGFTTTGANAASAFRYYTYGGNSANPSDPGWRQFASAYGTPDSNKFKQYMGIRLFYRGSKGEGLGYAPYTIIDPTVIGMWGPLNQGDQNVPLAKGTSANQDYNMVGNPYPSAVDIGTVVYNAKVAGRITGTAFYAWNPYLGTAGQFMPITIGTASATPWYIQANNCFQVRAAADGVLLNFHESNKSATSSYNLLKAMPEYVSLLVYDNTYHPYDMAYVQFNDAATNAEDNDYDAAKATGGATDVNFYTLSSDQHKLSIDGRPFKSDNVIPLGFHSDYAQEYIIKAESIAIPEGGKLYLHDKLLQQYVLLQAGTEYHFSVTADKNTQGENRFELSMSPSDAATSAAVKGLHVTMTPNPATDDVKISFTNGKKDNVSVRVMDLTGISIYNQDLGMLQNGTVSVPLGNFASGIYMVELTSGSQKVVQRLIKE